MRDVANWLGVDVTVLQSEKYANVDDVIDRTAYMVGPSGARCTTELKKKVRQGFERSDDVQVFGFTADKREIKRAANFREANPEVNLSTPLIDAGLTKDDCHRILAEAQIRPHAMYELGFPNANCIGCVKAASPEYWALTRQHFPDVFATRAAQERKLGISIIRPEQRILGRRVKLRLFLDELPETDTQLTIPTSDQWDCGVLCPADEGRGGEPT
jgi:hypothetical protein